MRKASYIIASYMFKLYTQFRDGVSEPNRMHKMFICDISQGSLAPP